MKLLRVYFTSLFLGLLLFDAVFASASTSLEDSKRANAFFKEVEDALQALQRQAPLCLRGHCTSDSGVYWVLSRALGASRVTRALSPSPSWLGEHQQRSLLAAIGALPSPVPRLESDEPVAMKLSTLGENLSTLVMFEYATGYPGERVGAIFDPARYFSRFARSPNSDRSWLFWSDGEVLVQSKGLFLGAQLGKTPYFLQREDKTSGRVHRSFDQVDVDSHWKNLGSFSIVALYEGLREPVIPAVRTWSWSVVLYFAACGVFGSGLVFYLSRSLWSFLLRRKARKRMVLDRLSTEELQKAIYKSRNLSELALRVSAVLEKTTGTEVFFLRYDKRTAFLFDPNAERFEIPLSTYGIHPGQPLPEIPSLRSAVLRRKDCSRLLAWPLMSSLQPGTLVGVFVSLNPSSRTRAMSLEIGFWMERAARYYFSILSPEGGRSFRRMFELRVVSRIHEQAFLDNFRTVYEIGARRKIIAMVKADAYGHGAAWASRILCAQSGLAALGVATVEEGVEIRKSLKDRYSRVPIIVFSGSTPWTSGAYGEMLGQLFVKYDLTPVISSIEDWRAFHKKESLRKSWSRKLPFELKFNTGMNRLGIGLEYLQEVRRDLVDLAAIGKFPSGIFSHLSVSEENHHPVTRVQQERFVSLVEILSAVLPSSVDFHLQNSASVWNLRKKGAMDWVTRIRPGLSLYGISPFKSKRSIKLKTVLNLEAPVIQKRRLRRGESVGYGAHYRSAVTESMAVLGIGYADGIHRAWSRPGSQARVLLSGKKQAFLGPISMDLCAVRASAKVRVGDWARLWGEGIDPWKQAAEAGTIPYEILTSFSRRVQRVYV